ncbi:MAG: hypothetical protein CMI36_05220 [Owenweeksia sp.]|nr:hypothetical protein [Owenweeksia sp.]
MKRMTFFVIVFITALVFSCSKESNSDQSLKTSLDKKTASYTAGEIHNLVIDNFLASRQQILSNTLCDVPSQACSDYFEFLANGYLSNYITVNINASTQSPLDFYNSSHWAAAKTLSGSALIDAFANIYSPEAAAIIQDAFDLVNVTTTYQTIYNGLDNLEIDAQGLASADHQEIVLSILDITRHSAIHWQNNNGGPGSWYPTGQNNSSLYSGGDPGINGINADLRGATQGAIAGFVASVESNGVFETLSGSLTGALLGATFASGWSALWSFFGYLF